tara:strand:- start:18749 stop:19849 length:1101 start_codon:yes stop_codon:yes gene_type:complete
MNKKKIAIIGIVGVPANYGGYETLVENLIDHIDYTKYEITIYCSTQSYKNQKKLKAYKNCKLAYIPIKANGIWGFFYDNVSLLDSIIKKVDVVLALGAASSFSYFFLKPFLNLKYIVNLDGQDNKREKFNTKTKKLLSVVRKLAIKTADKVIADNDAVLADLSTKIRNKSTLIEYGGDQVFKYENIEKLNELNLKKDNYFFKVCRIEPENNIHLILKAFKNTSKTFVCVGNWNNSAYGKNLKSIYAPLENIILLDPIYESNKLNLLRSNAVAYIHGHSRGGTNPSLVEAMNLSLFIISFDVVYNRNTLENLGVYFKDDLGLNSIIKDFKKDDTYFITRKKIFEVAKRRYTWKIISNKYITLINSFS